MKKLGFNWKKISDVKLIKYMDENMKREIVLWHFGYLDYNISSFGKWTDFCWKNVIKLLQNKSLKKKEPFFRKRFYQPPKKLEDDERHSSYAKQYFIFEGEHF